MNYLLVCSGKIWLQLLESIKFTKYVYGKSNLGDKQKKHAKMDFAGSFM